MENTVCASWRRSCRFACLLASAIMSFVVVGATWTGGGDGTSWGDALNWDGALPGATEAVGIDTGSAALTIDLGSTDRECGAITVTGTANLPSLPLRFLKSAF